MDSQGLASDKKKARRLNATICFIDQTGISEIPNVRKTWGVAGQTPILDHLGGWTNVSVMGAITLSPKTRLPNLYLKYHLGRAVKSPDVIVFLQDLMRHVRNNIIIVWDRGNIHRAGEVQRFLKKHKRLKAEYFPPYAPELNPMEGVWANLKVGKLGNFCPDDKWELLDGIIEAEKQVGSDRELLRSFVRGTPLPLRL